jgi:hypothetical protein
VIILSDSDEEEEVREETAANTEAASCAAVKSSTPAPSTVDADEGLGKMQDDNSDDLASGQDTSKSSGGGDEAGSPYAAAPRTTPATGVLQGELHSALLHGFLFCAEELG